MPTYTRTGQRRLPDEEIIALYLSGLDSETVGFRASCSPTTILDIVRRAGHQVRPPGNRPSRPKLLTDGEIIRQYRNGATGPEIAAAAGVTPNTVYAILKREGIPRRAPSASFKKGRGG